MIYCAGAVSYKQPHLVWSTAEHELAIRGQTKKLKCIFSGLSVPSVYLCTISVLHVQRRTTVDYSETVAFDQQTMHTTTV